MDRVHFATFDTIVYIWKELGLPTTDLSECLQLPAVDKLAIPSSFKVGHIAQASIALSALTAALVHAHGNRVTKPSKVCVPLQHALLEFASERYLTIEGKPVDSDYVPIGGLHKASDGYVRVHDSFPNHRQGAKRLLDCEDQPDTRATLALALARWKAVDFETAGQETALSVAACLRSFKQWDVLPQAAAITDFPILIHKILNGAPTLPPHLTRPSARKCLDGLKVIEMTRVIAAPVAGKTLAAHGADVIWITSQNLPDLPSLDRDVGRGKRTVQLDIEKSSDKTTLLTLLEDADVFIQSYRPGSLAAKGFTSESLASASRHGIIIANLSAYGPTGPWCRRRGFDSLVQTCTGLNVAEAERDGIGETVARPLPCQALDHASGYFLATGISAALYKRATEGGSFVIDVSLAGTSKYLRSLGQYEGASGFASENLPGVSNVQKEYLEEKESGFGLLKALRHSAAVDGLEVGWDVMPKPLGSDRAEWLEPIMG
ncbi:CoA-transferase family III [Polychaeton citri CBS 116435]|uniref:CoA-transferase family III n=1 Tax=Polychaeton citri CBS 116435 TaxID=1314669 RepID=A0A9P4Q8K6_9PEZI|nr:CoA-transferase family III [Polychaeton citri CBS 116435]